MTTTSDALTLNDLTLLTTALASLEAAGRASLNKGFEPIFSVVPLQFVAMRLDYVMPPSQGLLNLNVSGAADPVPFATDAPAPAAEMEAMLDEVFRAAHLGEALPSDAAPTQADLVQDEPEQVGGDAAEAAGEGLAALAPAATLSPQALPAEAAILTPDAPDVAPRPTPGSASALAASRPAPWTPEEDARLVRLVANAMRGGASKAAAIRFAAADLGRPEAGMGFRLHNKLAEALTAALAAPQDLLAAQVGANQIGLATAPEPAAPPPIEEHPAAAPNPVPPAAPATVPPGLRRHLASLSRLTHGRRWTQLEDLHLLEAATNGLKAAEIAVDLGLDTGRVKSRLEALCGSFAAAEVLAAWRATVA